MNNEVLGRDVNFTNSEYEVSLGISNYSNVEPLDVDLGQRLFPRQIPISLYNGTVGGEGNNRHSSNLSLRSLISPQSCKHVLAPVVVANVIAACYHSQEVGAQYYYMLVIKELPEELLEGL
ncbi:hypothetical protein M9H77_31278 [Catharanthus roseus]|uniref:Uncharacterized protein n=1 Tax=Catharanthus roseus TaxID=4058 RepID=A0ACC0A3J2_CATRO|nr:hypothetical protein M9H77_31278 [Catharanthus roseus]